MSTPTAQSIISDVRRRSPQVVELAQLLAPAVRIEAALVRRLRIELLPEVAAEVEARLWFSPLIQAHSADGLALSVPIAVALRRELAEQWATERRALLKRARMIYSDVHAYLPPPLRLEEEVAWCLIEGDADAADALLARAVAALVAEPDRFRFWAAQATARLPDGISMAVNGTRLAQAATAAAGEIFGPDWETTYRALGTKALAIRHVGAQLELGGPAGPLCRRIDVPDAAEVLLELRWPSATGVPVERITVDARDGAAPTQAWGSGAVEVRTAAGLTYLVHDDPFQRPCRVDQAADPTGQLRARLADQSIPGLRLPRDGETAELAIVSLSGRVTLLDASGRPFAGVPQLDPRDTSCLMLAAHVSRWLSIAELRSGSLLLAGAIEVTVAGPGTGPGQDIDLATTDQATVTITNLSSESLYAAVVALLPDWSVAVVWPKGLSALPPGGRGQSLLRLDVLGSEQREGQVRVIGVTAQDAFDPYPLTLPPLSPTSPFSAVPAASSNEGISALDTEFAIMTGAIPASPVPRYLAWTTSEALVRVRRPAGGVAAPLSTSGRFIVDARGERVRLAGVNWYGASEDIGIPVGLDSVNRGTLAELIATQGFNCVRLPFSVWMTEQTAPVPQQYLAANTDLYGKTPVEVYDACVEALTRQRLIVIPSCHLLDFGSCCSNDDSNGLWFNDRFPAAKFTETWQSIARRYAANPLVAAMDIKNEPRPAKVGGQQLNPTWGTAAETDFAAMYATVGNLIHQINPRPLIICEGLNYAGDLTGVASHPVRLAEPNKVVYSMHDYPWFGHQGQSQAAYSAQMTKNGGYLLTQGIAPVWVGEFGGDASALSSPGGGGSWWANIQAWLKEYDVDWCWWALNPTRGQSSAPGTARIGNQWGSAEPYGLLTSDWSDVGYPAVVSMLQALMQPHSGPGVG